MVSSIIPLAVLAALLGLGAADVTLPSYYFDGMVFQGERSDTLIWGFTDMPDVEVLVQVACNGQQKTLLRADPSGFKKEIFTYGVFTYFCFYGPLLSCVGIPGAQIASDTRRFPPCDQRNLPRYILSPDVICTTIP